MALDYTVDEIIKQIKLRAFIPDNSSESFNDADILRFMNYELTYYMVPLIMSIREEFFAKSDLRTVGSLTDFDMNVRAIGNKLRDVLRIDANGNKFSVARIEPEDLPRFNVNNNYMRGFVIEDNTIRILGCQLTSDILDLKYFRRPNKLITSTGCVLIDSLDTSAKTVTVNAASLTACTATFAATTKVDFIQANPNFKALQDDSIISSITGAGANVFSFAVSGVPTTLAAGDYVCLAKEAPVVQLPLEAIPLLCERTVMKMMQSLNDKDGYANCRTEQAECKEMLLQVLTDRVEGEDRKIVNTSNFAWRNRRFWIY